MKTSPHSARWASEQAGPDSGLAQEIAQAAHFLPAQGPITTFVHHNTLHAFEALPFEQALAQASARYGCEPFLSMARYRAELGRGRIRSQDLEAVLQEALGARGDEAIMGLASRFELYMAMLMDPVPVASEAEIQWEMAAADGVRSFHDRCRPWQRRQMVAETRQWVMRELRAERRPDAHLGGLSADVLARWDERRIESWSETVWEEVTLSLIWRICRSGTHAPARPAPAAPLRLRDALLQLYGQDPDLLVHETLIRFCSCFSDQGLAAWEMPARAQGFYRAFCALYGGAYPAREAWLRRLPAELARIEAEGLSPEALIEESLHALGVSLEQRQDFITESLLALRGWAGMLWQLETRPGRQAVPPGSLCEFLAVRLLLDRLASEHIAAELIGLREPLSSLRHNLAEHARRLSHAGQQAPTQAAYVVFLLAQSLGWGPQRLAGLSKAQWQSLVGELERFPSIERRRLFHRAYERRYRHQVYDALALHRPVPVRARRPALQLLCCLDDREESLRRHCEELEPQAESFGLAGFFGVAIYYRGVQDAHEMPLCPVAIRPGHRLSERAVSGDRASHARRLRRARHIGLAAQGLRMRSHGFVGGLATTLVGSLAAVPLVAQVLLPRLTARLHSRVQALVQAPVRTELALERQPGAQADGDGIFSGFLPAEMAAIVESQLRNIGLTRDFARLVLVVGHGSASLNNPHKAAYDCGACGGGSGGPNARAFAQMANHPAVRARLAEAGLSLPADTWFLAACHNTCDDSIHYYELDKIPVSHREDLERTRALLDRACARNAHERCRRFQSAQLLIGLEEARRHVEARSEDLGQPRPELGHATNAICVVGRRTRTRGLFMDRRAFLVSYDPASDADQAESPVLSRILQAVIPVCAGINLEYFFSHIDPSGWGCGTKLPHNITSLLGVMDGAASDLRPGLPWQMVELHEPVRLNLIVETRPDRLAGILARQPEIERLCRNAWIWLACLDPERGQIQVYHEGQFRAYTPEAAELPVAACSASWYEGLRELLDFAEIRAGEPGS